MHWYVLINESLYFCTCVQNAKLCFFSFTFNIVFFLWHAWVIVITRTSLYATPQLCDGINRTRFNYAILGFCFVHSRCGWVNFGVDKWLFWTTHPQYKYKARHAHKRLYTVLPKYSKIQVLPGITSCRLMKYNKQAIELNSLLINNMPKDGN